MTITLLISSLGLLAPTPTKAAPVGETYAWVRTSPAGMIAITYGNGLYVGIQNKQIYTSPDLVNWTKRDVSAQTRKGLNTVKFLNGKFYAATTRDDAQPGATFIYSSDGINWSAGSGSAAYDSYAFSSIAYANGKYLATSSNGGGIVGSSDGIAWSNTTIGIGNTSFYDIKYVSNRFIAVGINRSVGGIVRQSSDNTGTNWGAETPILDTSSMNGLASNGSQVIAVGDSGKISRTDAANPQLPTIAVPSPVTANLTKVAYDSSDGGWYVAVGANGTIITSKDGLNWKNEVATLAYDYYYDVIYGADTFVAVSSGGVYKRVQAYTISFDSNGGSTVNNLIVPINEKATQPAAPTKTGFTFEGWYSDSEALTPFDFTTTPITSDITLYAKWTANRYTVNFNSNGGSSVDSQSVTHNGFVTEPEPPTRVGYEFSGWYANVQLTTPFHFATAAITANTELYAKWAVSSYTVSFQSNGGSSVSSQSVTYNGFATEPAAPTREGHGFAGWYANPQLTTPFHFTTSAITVNTVVYAKWTVNSYTVSFQSNGGSSIGSQSVNYNGFATEPEAPVREGYGFAGWYANAPLTTPFHFATTAITANTAIYAKWTLLPLAAPANVTASAGDKQATISWSSVTGATYYKVFQGTSPNTYNDTPVATVSGSTYNYNVINLTNGITYYFAIKAGNTVTSSVYSNEVAVAPAAVVLPGLSVVNVSSDNPNPAFAKAGDTVTLTFIVNKALNGLPLVTIEGQPVEVVSAGNSVYSAKYTFTGNEASGVVLFTIDFTDTSGNAGERVTNTSDGSSVTFDNEAPSGTLRINDGASLTTTTLVALAITSTDGSGSGNIQMRFSNDNVNWSEWEAAAAAKAWTLTNGSGSKTVYMMLKDAAGNVTAQAVTASIVLQGSSSGSSGSRGSSGASQNESITVNVENSGSTNKTVVSTVIISRTTDANGLKKDNVIFTPEQVAKTVEQLTAAGFSSARVVLPDTKDEVAETNIEIPHASAELLAKGSVGIELITNNVRVDIPDRSLLDFKDDVYFRLVPVKEEDKRKEIEQRARTEQVVKLASGSSNAVVIGRPMMIDTNLQSRPVTLILPLDGTLLTKQQLNDLGVFIEHSDGTKELIQGEIVSYDESGKLGIRFSINKFSTFTIVYIENWNGKEKAESASHKAFISGYTDGLFKPDASITRAEMAAIAAKALDKELKATSVSFTDVPADHWAKDVIDRVTKMGLMEGYPDGSFKPEQTITRAEMASLVARVNNASAGNGASFSDVDGHWAQKAIERAKAANIINGYEDGTFRPEAKLTRAEAVTMISKLLGRGPLNGAASKWTDVPSSHWAYGYILEASIDHTAGQKTNNGEQWVK